MPRQYTLPGKSPGLLARIFAILAAALIAIVSLMFSIVVFAIALAIGAVVWGWLWWKTRELRKQMRQDPLFREAARQAAQGTPGQGDVIEGVVIREVPDDSEQGRGPRRP